jgi:FKBP-type peptidyl-prolyl cis-trans isomerase SlpA
MTKVKENDWISVEYTGKLADGKVFDTNEGKEPLKFQVGKKMVIPGFDKAVVDMEEGETKEIKISSEKAYGARTDKIIEIPKASFQKIDEIEVDKELTMMTNFGPMLIEPKEIGDEKVKVIINHPLAGKDLDFKIKVLKILNEKEVKEYNEKLQEKYKKMQEMMEQQQKQNKNKDKSAEQKTENKTKEDKENQE